MKKVILIILSVLLLSSLLVTGMLLSGCGSTKTATLTTTQTSTTQTTTTQTTTTQVVTTSTSTTLSTLTGTGTTTSTQPTGPKYGGTLTVSEPIFPGGPLGYPPERGFAEVIFQQPCLEALLWQSLDGVYHARLATEWTVADDGSSVTFKLRKGVLFHDGSEFDAGAVVWNVEKVLKQDAPHFDASQVGVTASRMPTNSERLTMACPICSSRTPARRATGSTLK